LKTTFFAAAAGITFHGRGFTIRTRFFDMIAGRKIREKPGTSTRKRVDWGENAGAT
jgi:hypothetical protein